MAAVSSDVDHLCLEPGLGFGRGDDAGECPLEWWDLRAAQRVHH